MCRTLLLLSLSAALLGGCKEFPDDLPPPSDSAPGKILLLDSLTPPDAQTGWWPDIGADSKDHVHVIYCDVYHGDLVYAHRNTKGVWSKERVDVAGAVGKYASMAVAPTGEIHVAYYDQTQKYLRYAKRSLDGSWTKSNIVWGLEVGMASETVLDQREHPTSFTIARPDFLFTRLQMQRTLPNGINTSCTKHSVDSLHAFRPSSMVTPFGFPTSIGISAKLHST